MGTWNSITPTQPRNAELLIYLNTEAAEWWQASIQTRWTYTFTFAAILSSPREVFQWHFGAIVGRSVRQVSGSTKMKNGGTQRIPARSECSRSIISLTNSFVWVSSGAFKSFISVLHPKLQLMAVLAHGSVFSPVGGAASGVLQASQHNTS